MDFLFSLLYGISKKQILTEIERHQECIFHFDAGYFEKGIPSNCYFCNLIDMVCWGLIFTGSLFRLAVAK